MENKSELLVKPEDITMVSSALTAQQLQYLLKRTPAKYVKERPAKGGGTWKYVSGGYVRKVLNSMFGFNWDFQILEQQILHGEAIVKGRLTIRNNGVTIIKEQFGNKDIMFKRGTETALSIGNDLKAAATDALKKCAAEIGVSADIYNADEFREVKVDVSDESVLKSEHAERAKLMMSDCKSQYELYKLYMSFSRPLRFEIKHYYDELSTKLMK